MTISWDDLRGALAAAPEAAQQPSIASSLATSGFTGDDLTTAAQGAVGAVQSSAADAVVQEHKKQGIFGSLVSSVTHTVSGVWDSVPGHGVVNDAANVVKSPLGVVAHWANYPLAQVQHSYRYYHDVAVHHGAASAMGTLFSNFATSGFNPAGIAADPVAQNAGAQITGSSTSSPVAPYFQDSWDRSANATISPGRDLAGLFQLKPGTKPYTLVSGAGDAAFDIGTDPLLKASALSKAITGSARAIATAEDLERLAAGSRLSPVSAPVVRALSDMAAEKSSVRIASNYPMLKHLTTTAANGDRVPLTVQLAKADTTDKVVDVLRNHLASGEYLGYSGTPTYSLTRVPFRKLNDLALRSQQPKAVMDDLVSDPDLANTKSGLYARFANKVGRSVNAFTNHTPFVFNAKNELVADSVHPNNPAAAHTLYSVMRYGQSEQVARDVADQFANASTVAEKASIWNRGIVQLANAAGIPNDAEFRNRFIGDLDGLADVTGSGADTKYGFDHLGNDLSYVTAEDGSQVAAPLFTSQGGEFAVPSLAEFNTAARAVRAFGKMYGPVDDFVYNTFTAGYFKKWALLSGGFAIRNSMSEMMTRVIGADGMKVVQSGIAAAATRLGHKLAPGELEDVQAQLAHSADPELLKKLVDDPRYTETAAEVILRHGGTFRTPASVAAGHSATYDAGDASRGLAENVSRFFTPGHKGARLDPDRYVKYTQSAGIERLSNVISGHASLIARDEGARVQAQAYRQSLASGATHDEAAADATAAGVDWLTNTAAGREAQDYIKRSRWASDPSSDQLIDWAGKRVAAIRGVTTNKDGEVIKPLLDGIADTADSSTTHINLHPDNVKALGLDNLPINGVPGMAVTETAVDKPISRLVNAGYSHVLTPIIQNLARNPIYLSHVQDELKIALKIPGLSRDEAWHMAEQRASERMIPEIHNPLDKSMFAQSVRNLVPFFFAREQAAKRFVQAMNEDPFGWRKLQLGVHGMKDAGFIHTDNNGQMYFNYPLSGELGKFVPMALSKLGVNTAIGVPSGFRGDITGLAPGGDVPGEGTTTVGWSPLVTVPMNGLANVFPELRPVVASPLGAGPISANQSLWEQFMPNATLRNVVKAYAGDHSRAFVGSMIDAMQYKMAHGDMPPTNAQPGDPAWQAWIDGIRNQTRAMFAVRALMGIGSPTSPILENGDHGMTDEYQSFINKDGLSAGTQEFLAKYPNAGAYTVFKSEGAGGVNVPETTAAWDWTKTNMSFVKDHGEAGSLFIPQTQQSDPNALAIYQQQMAAGFRHQKMPDEFAQQVMVQQGWNQYEADKAKLDEALQGVSDPTQQQTMKSNFYTYVTTQLGPSAPLWFADYNNNTARNAQKKIIASQLIDMFDKGQAPDSPMTPLLRGLVEDYKTYQASLASSATSPVSRTTMKDNWNAYLAQLVQEHPELTTAVNRVFKGA